MKHRLNSSKVLTQELLHIGIYTWEDLIVYVSSLPYGRNSNREDFSLVLKEQKGSCSSKHALLLQVAIENKLSNVQLILAMYKMNEINTPGIGADISEGSLPYIPEAHCYLKINGIRVDLTSKTSDIKRIEMDILNEIEIAPKQVVVWKVGYHKQYIKEWLISEGIQKTFEEVWSIRERCIQNLTFSS